MKEEMKITQLSNDIKDNINDISELRQSINHLMQNVTTGRPKNPTGNIPRMLNQDIPYNNSLGTNPGTSSLHFQPALTGDSKNYVRQNQHYPMD